jgi:hypothetical protein
MEGVFCFEKSKTLLKIGNCKTDFKPRGIVLENKNLQKDLLSKLELISKLSKTLANFKSLQPTPSLFKRGFQNHSS